MVLAWADGVARRTLGGAVVAALVIGLGRSSDARSAAMSGTGVGTLDRFGIGGGAGSVASAGSTSRVEPGPLGSGPVAILAIAGTVPRCVAAGCWSISGAPRTLGALSGGRRGSDAVGAPAVSGAPTASHGYRVGRWLRIGPEAEGLEQALQLAGGEVAPGADGHAAQAQRAHADPTQPGDGDADRLHDPTDDVVHALVDHHRQDQAVVGLAEDAELPRDDSATVDRHPVADPLQCLLARPREGQDVVLLVELVAGVHHPVGDIAVVGQEQEPLGVAVEPADRKDALPHVDEVHDRPPVALVADGRDVAAWLVEQDVPGLLGSEELAVDPEEGGAGIDLGAELGDDLAVDRDPPGANHLLGGAARSHPAGRHHALQAFHGWLRGVRR